MSLIEPQSDDGRSGAHPILHPKPLRSSLSGMELEVERGNEDDDSSSSDSSGVSNYNQKTLTCCVIQGCPSSAEPQESFFFCTKISTSGIHHAGLSQNVVPWFYEFPLASLLILKVKTQAGAPPPQTSTMTCGPLVMFLKPINSFFFFFFFFFF